LRIRPHDAKNLYRRGVAFTHKHDVEKAQSDLNAANSLVETPDRLILEALADLQKEKERLLREERTFYAKSFGATQSAMQYEQLAPQTSTTSEDDQNDSNSSLEEEFPESEAIMFDVDKKEIQLVSKLDAMDMGSA
jgi:hypothetical protein